MSPAAASARSLPSAATELWLALAVIVGTVTGCAVIRFEDGTVVDGISWFGVQRETVLPYAAGMLATAGLQAHAARRLPTVPSLDPVRRFLRASAVLMLGILVTPYAVAPWLEVVHDSLGAGLFAVQLAFATHLPLSVAALVGAAAGRPADGAVTPG